METRIKLIEIEAALNDLNTAKEMPLESWSFEDGVNKANVGNYHLSQAYGGFNVVQHVNTGGGCCEPAGSGHVTKRECLARIWSLS